MLAANNTTGLTQELGLYTTGSGLGFLLENTSDALGVFRLDDTVVFYISEEVPV